MQEILDIVQEKTGGMERRYFDVHILDRIEPIGDGISDHDRIRMLRDENSQRWKKILDFKKIKIIIVRGRTVQYQTVRPRTVFC